MERYESEVTDVLEVVLHHLAAVPGAINAENASHRQPVLRQDPKKARRSRSRNPGDAEDGSDACRLERCGVAAPCERARRAGFPSSGRLAVLLLRREKLGWDVLGDLGQGTAHPGLILGQDAEGQLERRGDVEEQHAGIGAVVLDGEQQQQQRVEQQAPLLGRRRGQRCRARRVQLHQQGIRLHGDDWRVVCGWDMRAWHDVSKLEVARRLRGRTAWSASPVGGRTPFGTRADKGIRRLLDRDLADSSVDGRLPLFEVQQRLLLELLEPRGDIGILLDGVVSSTRGGIALVSGPTRLLGAGGGFDVLLVGCLGLAPAEGVAQAQVLEVVGQPAPGGDAGSLGLLAGTDGVEQLGDVAEHRLGGPGDESRQLRLLDGAHQRAEVGLAPQRVGAWSAAGRHFGGGVAGSCLFFCRLGGLGVGTAVGCRGHGLERLRHGLRGSHRAGNGRHRCLHDCLRCWKAETGATAICAWR